MEYFFEAKDNESKPILSGTSYKEVREYLEQVYNYADKLRNRRFEEDQGKDFDELVNDVEKLELNFEEKSDYKDELKKLKFLTLGNIWLRKGQYLDEGFHDSQECYRMAADLLWQICDHKSYNCDSLLVRMNLGKYYRNRGKLGRRSYYKSAENEFNDIIETIEKNVNDTISASMAPWELHLWLEAKINIGRGQKSAYDLDKAEKSFWKIVKYLIVKLSEAQDNLYDYISIRARLQRDENLRNAFKDAKDISIYVKMPSSNNQKRVYALYRAYLLQAMVQLAIVYRKKHFYDQAEALCNIILSFMDTENIDAQNEKGACLRKRGMVAEAKDFFEKNGEQGNRFAKLNLWKCKLAQKELKLEDIQKDLDKNQKNLDILLIKGGILKQKNCWKKAYNVYKKIYDEAPYVRQGTNALKAYYNMAKCLLALNQVNQAQQILEKIDADCDKKDVKTSIELGECYMKLKKYTDALKVYEGLIDQMSEEGEITIISQRWIINRDTEKRIYENCGKCHYKLGHREGAITMFNRVKDLDPVNVDAIFNLAQCQIYHDDGMQIGTEQTEELMEMRLNYEKAISDMKKVVEQCPRESRFISGLAIARMRYLALAPVNALEVKEQMKYSLKYIQGPYSLKACIAFATFVEEETKYENRMKESQSEELFRAFSRIVLGKREEGHGAFADLQKEPEFQRLDAVTRGKVLVKLFKIYENIVGIKNVCRATKKPNDIPVHYTSVDTLKKLLAKEDGNIKSSAEPRMRLWNSVYMNDPFEGETFFDLIKKEAILEASKQKTNDTPSKVDEILKKYFLHLKNGSLKGEAAYPNLTPVNSNVYITSFSQERDNIQMWVQYAAGAKGCNIAFDDSFFDIRHNSGKLDDTSIYTDQDYPLYKIQYIHENDLDSSDDNDMKRIGMYIKEIWIYLNKLEKEIIEETIKEDNKKEEVIRNFVTNCLNEVRFLFKDKEYEHEDEYRLVQYSHNPKIDEEHFRIPRLYIEVNRKIQVEQVMLGPKVSQEEVNEIVSWLYASKGAKKVTQSIRHYK